MEPALPSTVTVVNEETVSRLQCHSRGFEKVIWPIVCLAILVLSILLFAVGCGTPNWIQMEVRNNASEERGNITFGLLRGSHRIRYGESPFINTINGSYFLHDRFALSYLAKLNATFALSMIAILLCFVNIAVTLLNSYQSVTTWWRGPTMMYLLSLLTSLCGLAAVGVFLDHYLWDLDTVEIFLRTTELRQENPLSNTTLLSTSFEYLLTNEGYHLVPFYGYSFYLDIAGACVPLLVTLLAWRLALLIPSYKPHRDPQHSSPLKDSNSLQYISPVPNPHRNLSLTLQNLPFEHHNYGDVGESAMTASQDYSISAQQSLSSLHISPQTQKDVLY